MNSPLDGPGEGIPVYQSSSVFSYPKDSLPFFLGYHFGFHNSYLSSSFFAALREEIPPFFSLSLCLQYFCMHGEGGQLLTTPGFFMELPCNLNAQKSNHSD
ncbi:unnamed protein product [Linum trigynum]|uniref:Uncharacterized protein n=1 Tax=Linum trigynum TaxID=586398 RepID=A0AAV2EEP6_9ROSI